MAHQAQAMAHSHGTHFLLVKRVKTRSTEGRPVVLIIPVQLFASCFAQQPLHKCPVLLCPCRPSVCKHPNFSKFIKGC